MAAPKGNSNAVGNRGGGRISVKDEQWHKVVWEQDTDVRALEAKVASGKYSARDVYQLRALKADVPILRNMADKVLATLVDHTTLGESLAPSVHDSESEALAKEYEDKLRVQVLKKSVTSIPTETITNITSLPS